MRRETAPCARFLKNVPFPLGKFANSQEAWFRRIQSGQGGHTMFRDAVKELGGAALPYFADWTDRIAKGELPHAKPQRPQGVERNVVVTTWDWLDEKHYLHDLIASDRRYPTVNAYGPVYGSTELQHRHYSGSRSENTHRQELQHPRARDPDTPVAAEANRCSRRRIGATKQIWTAKPTTTTVCSIARARLVRRGGPRPEQSGLLQKGLGPSFG